jgi:hypothetical protein
MYSYSKLINKSVPGTVDMRALSKISGSSSQRAEAKQDNMTLALESARAIGCRINDSTAEKILCKDPESINGFLLDLVRVSDVPAAVLMVCHCRHTYFYTCYSSVNLARQVLPVTGRCYKHWRM